MWYDLRPYQSECLDQIAISHRQGITRQLVALPTGAGKTVVFSTLAHHRGAGVLVLAHRKELLAQAAGKLEKYYPGEVSILRGKSGDLTAPVLVTSVQTAKNRIEQLQARCDHTLIIDEAHHATAQTYTSVIDGLGFMAGNPERLLLGVTATAKRGDRVGLGAVFQEIVFSRSMLDLMQAGYLSDLRGIHIKTRTALTGVNVTAGDFNQGELARAVNTPERNRIIVESFSSYGNFPAVAFCVDIEHAHDLAGALRDVGFRAETVSGKTPQDERDKILDRLQAGDLDVVTNCNVLTEGFDCPPLRCLLMARPTKSDVLYTQMVGRGTRLSPETGKKDCLILDFTDNRGDVCTLATLAGKPIKQNQTVKQAIEQARRMEAITAPQVLGVNVESFDLFRQSRLAWYQKPETGNWVLKIGAGVILVIIRTRSGRWCVRCGERFLSTKGVSLNEAFRIAEKYAVIYGNSRYTLAKRGA